MLEREIKSDIEERLRLMNKIKMMHLRYHFKQDDEQIFLNYSIPAVYAIWEGFVTTAFSTYIAELNKLNLTIDTLCKPILIHHLETRFKQFREYPEKANGKIAFFDKLNQFYQSEFIEITREINTESNVGFKVLNKILGVFNLTHLPEYIESRYSIPQELDNFLLKTRNAVAHGQNSVVIHHADVERAIKLVEILMDLVFDRIVNGFQNETYLNKSN